MEKRGKTKKGTNPLLIVLLLISFLITLLLNFFLLNLFVPWAMCECLFNDLRTPLIIILSLIAAFVVGDLTKKTYKKNKNYIATYIIALIISFGINLLIMWISMQLPP